MSAPAPQNAPTLDAATLATLGHGLSGLYAEALERPVPDYLLGILQRLERPTLIAGAGPGRDQAWTRPTALAN